MFVLTIGTPAELKYTLQTYGIPSSIFPVSDDGQILKELDLVRWSERRPEERSFRQRQLTLKMAAKAGQYPSASKPHHLSTPIVDGLVPFSSKHPSGYPVPGKVDSTGFPTTVPSSPNSTLECRRSNSDNGKNLTRVLTPGNNDVLLGRGLLSQLHVGNIRFRRLIDQFQNSYDAASKNEKTRMASEVVKLVKFRNGRFLKAEGSTWVEVEDSISRSKVANCFRTSRHRRKKRTDPTPVNKSLDSQG